MSIWDSFLPQFIFPQTNSFPEFVTWCHFRYISSQRAIIAKNNDILFTISPKSICQILKIKPSAPLHSFSIDSLMEIYQKLTFPQRAKIFEIFLLENVELRRTSPPYPSSMFPKMTRQVISIVSCLLGYPTNQWVDESILGFLSVFLVGDKPSLMFNYNKFLAEAIQD